MGQSNQMPVVQTAVRVVEQVQMLDQNIFTVTVGGFVANQRAHLQGRCLVNLATLEFAFQAQGAAQLIGCCNSNRLDAGKHC